MDLVSTVWPYVAALLPTAGLLYLFAVIMKHILEGDRRERAALRELDAQSAKETDPDVDTRPDR